MNTELWLDLWVNTAGCGVRGYLKMFINEFQRLFCPYPERRKSMKINAFSFGLEDVSSEKKEKRHLCCYFIFSAPIVSCPSAMPPSFAGMEWCE